MFDFKSELIDPIPTFTPKSSIAQALVFLKQNNLSHLPLTNDDGQFLGCLYHQDFQEESAYECIKEIIYDLEHFYLQSPTTLNVFEIYDILINNDANVLAVIDQNKQLLGIVKKQNLLNFWPSTLFLDEVGTTLVVSHHIQQYSISTISQIVEGNNAKLYGIVALQTIEDQMHILFKKNKHNTKIILDELRRYGYQIITHHIEDDYLNDLQERSQYINKFLNI